MKPITVYMASKVIHGTRWVELFGSFKAIGLELLSTWVHGDLLAPDCDKDCIDLWQRCLNESASADVLILYREPGEQLKGALVELGAALAAGRAIITVGDFEGAGSWPALPQIRHAKSMDAAMMMAQGLSVNVDRDRIIHLKANETRNVLSALEIAYGDDEDTDLSDEDYGALIAKFD
jgi:hypothetical protein